MQVWRSARSPPALTCRNAVGGADLRVRVAQIAAACVSRSCRPGDDGSPLVSGSSALWEQAEGGDVGRSDDGEVAVVESCYL